MRRGRDRRKRRTPEGYKKEWEERGNIEDASIPMTVPRPMDNTRSYFRTVSPENQLTILQTNKYLREKKARGRRRRGVQKEEGRDLMCRTG